MNVESTDRRDFLKGAVVSSLMIMFSEDDLMARALGQTTATPGPAVKLGLIGAGVWGRECLSSLANLSSARVTAICDSYEPSFKRALEIQPKAQTYTDYRKMLEAKDVDAVIIATPTHLHRDIAVAALQAGKHVYCEMPMALSLEDARAIAMAAKHAATLKFQSGLQGRSNALFNHINHFVKTGVLGTPALVSAQWNKKESWRRAAPSPDREKDLNWRLSRATSLGLAGEIGIHQLDLATWYLKALPTAITGSGVIANWSDGRDVADTIQCLIEFPKSVRMVYSSTLASSFSGSFTVFEGSNSSLVLRDNRGWMIKEADSPLLGWEVYARKEPVHNETGICMVADATKLIEEGKEPGKDGPLEPTRSALYLAFDNFTRSIRENTPVIANALDGFRATALAIKANEAVTTGAKVPLPAGLFDLN